MSERHDHDGGEHLDRVRENFRAWHRAIAPCRELALLQAEEEGERAAPQLAKSEEDAADTHPVAEQFAALSEEEGESLTLRMLSIEERLAFCRALSPLPRTETAAPLPAPATVAVLDNPFFAAATERFSEKLGELTPQLVSNFAEISEEVGAGRVTFGILPLEDSDDGKLYRFYEQADRFELHIRYTCDVPYRDGSRTMRLALLSRNDSPLASEKGELMLECSLAGTEDCTEAELLTVAAACGLALRRVDSLPTPYAEDSFLLRSVFRATAEGAWLFETFIRYFMPRATVTARYVHLK